MTEKEILAKVIIEVVGAPKEHVEKAVDTIIERISKNDLFKMLKKSTFNAEKIEQKELENFWSAFAEFDIAFKNIKDLIGFCFDYMPSSIEIIEPETFALDVGKISDLLNDLLARLHQYDFVVKNLRAENMMLKKEKE